MQVNRSTFAATLPHFQELLSSCDFYSFDEEMTGIAVSEENATMTPDESYTAKRLVASRYSIIQVGICLFHKKQGYTEDGQHSYDARPFNFFVFPNRSDLANSSFQSERDVVMNSSTVAFLQKHHLDFQSWIYNGIPYCTSDEKNCLQKSMVEGEEKHLSLTEEAFAWVRNGMELAKELQASINDSDSKAQGSKAKGRSLSTFQNKYAQRELEKQLRVATPSVILKSIKGTPTLTVLAPQEKTLHDKKERVRKEVLRCDTFGFKLVFDSMVASRKTCVGHNCFADLLFLMESLDAALPPSLWDWKKRVNDLFPSIYDTKYLSTRSILCSGELLQSNYLGGLFKKYGLESDLVSVSLPLGFQGYDASTLEANRAPMSNNLEHEAGYDALMTGVVFLNMLHSAGYSLTTLPQCCENKVSLFASLYALNLLKKRDEYLPPGFSILELAHDESLDRYSLRQHLELNNSPIAALYSVSRCRSLLVLPPSAITTKVVALCEERSIGAALYSSSSHFFTRLFLPVLKWTPKLFRWR